MTSEFKNYDTFVKILKISTEADWGDYKSESENGYTKEKFFGKSVEEILDLYENCPTSTYGYLEQMPEIPCRYYIFGFAVALSSNGSYPERYSEIKKLRCN